MHNCAGTGHNALSPAYDDNAGARAQEIVGIGTRSVFIPSLVLPRSRRGRGEY